MAVLVPAKGDGLFVADGQFRGGQRPIDALARRTGFQARGGQQGK